MEPNVFDLQKILGHTDIKMTMRYAHYSPEHLQKAMQSFELGLMIEPTHILTTARNTKLDPTVSLEAMNGQPSRKKGKKKLPV